MHRLIQHAWLRKKQKHYSKIRILPTHRCLDSDPFPGPGASSRSTRSISCTSLFCLFLARSFSLVAPATSQPVPPLSMHPRCRNMCERSLCLLCLALLSVLCFSLFALLALLGVVCVCGNVCVMHMFNTWEGNLAGDPHNRSHSRSHLNTSSQTNL